MAASLSIQYSEHDHIYSSSIVFFANLPIMLLDLLLSFWVIQAYRRTLSYLNKKNQTYKFQILIKMYYCFLGCIGMGVLCYLIEIMTARKGQNRDYFWKSNAYWENYSFIIVSIYTGGLMYILRPEANSHKLQDIDELVDETL